MYIYMYIYIICIHICTYMSIYIYMKYVCVYKYTSVNTQIYIYISINNRSINPNQVIKTSIRKHFHNTYRHTHAYRHTQTYTQKTPVKEGTPRRCNGLSAPYIARALFVREIGLFWKRVLFLWSSYTKESWLFGRLTSQVFATPCRPCAPGPNDG